MTELKQCPVCSNIPSKVFDPTQNIIVAAYHNQRSGNIGLIVADDNGSMRFDISFCPWCGKDLKRADNG